MGETQKYIKDPLLEVKYIPSDNERFTPLKLDVKPDTLYLRFTCYTASLLLIYIGSMFTWTSPALPHFLLNNTNENPLGQSITTIETSMLIGLPILLSLPVPLLVSPLAELLGRKKSMLLLGIVMLIFNFALAFSSNVTMLIVSRCLLFFPLSGCIGLLTVFISEICEDHNRAKYLCIQGVFLTLGNLFSLLVGPYFTVKIFTIVNTLPLIVFLILFLPTPETPVYSLIKGKEDECNKTLLKLRANKSIEEIENDFIEIKNTVDSNKDKKNITFISVFKIKEGRIGIFLGLIPIFSQFLTGAPILLSLVTPIFNQTGNNLSGDTVAIWVGIFQVVSIIFTLKLIDKFGRKPLLLVSLIGCAISLFLLGVYFYLKRIESSVINQLQWLPFTSILIYIALYSIGAGSVAQAILGELFAVEIRNTAISAIMTIGLISVFTTSAGFPFLEKSVGLEWCFWIFTFICIICAILVYTMLPETKGKSNVEIQSILRKYKC